MAFLNKFKPNTNDVPAGVKIENTSFGYEQNQKPYTKPQLSKEAITVQKAKPRGGWDDDDDEEPQLRGGSGINRVNQNNQQQNSRNIAKSPLSANSNSSNDLGLGPSTRKINPMRDYEIMQIDEGFVSSHSFENKTINDIIQPGGARLKQPDNVLNNFCKACESFQVPVVGSLLLSKLSEDLPFVSKARNLYLIEALVKKVKKYNEYFKYNLTVLKNIDFSNEASGDQLMKIVEDIIQYIEQPNKPKPEPVRVPTTTVPSTAQTTVANTNLLGDSDLLGGFETKSKPDPFAFIKKQPVEVNQSQPTHSRSVSYPQGSQLLDLDFGTQPSSNPQQQHHFAPQSQSINQAQNQQNQTKKFNPFSIGGSAAQTTNIQNKPQEVKQPETQPVSKPSGSTLNFKKFQASQNTSNVTSSIPAQTTTIPQKQSPQQTHAKSVSALDQLDDLLENFSGINFSNTDQQTSSNQQGGTSFPNGFSAQGPTAFGGNSHTSNGLSSQQANSFKPQGPSQPQPGFFNQQANGRVEQHTTQSFLSHSSSLPSFSASSTQPQNTRPGFPMPNQTMSQPQPQFGGPGGMNSGPFNGGYPPNSFPGYGPSPIPGYGGQPQWNGGYPQGYGAFNGQPGSGYGYGNPQFFGGNQGQSQPGGFGGSFAGPNNMYGGAGNYFPGQPGMPGGNMQGGAGQQNQVLNLSPEEMNKRKQKEKNEELFESLKF